MGKADDSDFPAAKKGLASQIGLQCVLSEWTGCETRALTSVAWTTAVLWLLRRDQRKGLKAPADDEGLGPGEEEGSDSVKDEGDLKA